ncbi:MAG: hypothetical protein EOP68_22015, partial [Sphingomonas sp.]
MTSPHAVVVVRPEPGNGRTAVALRALGLDVRQVPLFAVTPVDWSVPDPAEFDGLLLTSANAVRHGGAGLDALKRLPVIAVGAATAAAATDAGFAVAVTGSGDARDAVSEARDRGFARLLHLAGRDRAPTGDGIEAITVYASDDVPIDATVAQSFADTVVLLHSERAAARLKDMLDTAGTDRSGIEIAAISAAVAEAAGTGWATVSIAPQPSDPALVALAAARANIRAIDHPVDGGDKHAMSDYVPTDRPRARGPRMGVIIALTALAFIAGLALMAYAARKLPWFGATASTTAGAPVAGQKAGAAAWGWPSGPSGC